MNEANIFIDSIVTLTVYAFLLAILPMVLGFFVFNGAQNRGFSLFVSLIYLVFLLFLDAMMQELMGSYGLAIIAGLGPVLMYQALRYDGTKGRSAALNSEVSGNPSNAKLKTPGHATTHHIDRSNPTDEDVNTRINNADEFKECRRCAELIRKRAVYCRFCHYEYSEADLKQEREIQANEIAKSQSADNERKREVNEAIQELLGHALIIQNVGEYRILKAKNGLFFIKDAKDRILIDEGGMPKTFKNGKDAFNTIKL